ncbi:MAG TPA: HAMP domain-containing sensor histidine kinase [Candidatus Dormibacteraeota bacterium]|nr:HAMP domain-containing sensor histidine kinase [Candidatus Dormibacteraeota bacterium]
MTALGLALFGLMVYALAARAAAADQDRTLRQHAQDAALALRGATDDSLRPRVLPAAIDLRTRPDVFVEVLDGGGAVLSSTGQLDGRPPAIPPWLVAAAPATGAACASIGQPPDLRVCVQRWVRAADGRHGVVVAGQGARVPADGLGGIRAFLVISGVPSLLAALLACWLVARRALRPLRQVSAAADDIGRTQDFTRRLPPRSGRDEVAALTASFNRMLGQLDETYGRLATSLEAQRRFVADASHELRTPLTTIQGNAGLLAFGPPLAADVQADAARDITAESERMARLVERLLTLARADAGLGLRLAPVELSALVQEVCRQAAAVHPELAIADCVTPAWIDGDQDALRQLLWILLDNAARHGRSSATAVLGAEQGWARLSVADDGPGIPLEERERVFERFYRADPARSGGGAGLGLAIARWIAEQHRGRILAGGSDRGAVFYVDIPLLRGS